MEVDREYGVGVEDRKKRELFEKGASIEGEFVLTLAMGSFCKEAVRAGRFLGWSTWRGRC
jgi:hypothetical protein